eukprot:5787459-Prorocentrum_lima.AAC.1
MTSSLVGSEMCIRDSYCYYFNEKRIFDDVFELCGGTAKVSVILIRRRHYRVGPNFDAVVGIDLAQPQQVQELWRDIRECKPVCGVMAPP